jgi:CheY-like chemotaxis protein
MINNQALHSAHVEADGPGLQMPLRGVPLTVLIVEDSEDIRMMMRILLEMEGYRVIEAADGLRAIELAIHERPALIMMDLTLPVLDGIAATGRIREYLPEVPVVALSGHATDDYRSAALAAGCTEYLVKPLDFKLLDNILGRLSHRAAELQ